MPAKKITLTELRRLVRQTLAEGKTPMSFIKNDEVYMVGQSEPLGMVVGTGPEKVMVRRHRDGKRISVHPDMLYLGKEWHMHNRG